MSNAPLMPKATAVWLLDNTALTFDQGADFQDAPVGNRVAALDALGGVAIGDGADLERVHFGEIGHLVEGQRGVINQPHGSRLWHQRCIAHGKSPLCFAHLFGGEAGSHQR